MIIWCRTYLFLRAAPIFFCLVVLSGCISIPEKLKAQVSSDAHATSGHAIGPMTVFMTASYMQGASRPVPRLRRIQACLSKSSDIEIYAPSMLAIDDKTEHSLCDRVSGAIDYVGGFPTHRARLAYRVELYPAGIEITRRGLSLYPGHRRLTFAFAWSDTQHSTANIVNTMAHETWHALAGIERLPKPKRIDEDTAYLAGACAQLQILGTLDPNGLSVSALAAQEGIPARAIVSSEAGSRFLRRFSGASNGESMQRDTPSGKAFLASCDAELSAYFE